MAVLRKPSRLVSPAMLVRETVGAVRRVARPSRVARPLPPNTLREPTVVSAGK
jgi:hypothetical protein